MTRPIGKARVTEDEDGVRIDAVIWDKDAQQILLGETLTHLSVDTGHFVRDKEQERKLPWQQS